MTTNLGLASTEVDGPVGAAAEKLLGPVRLEPILQKRIWGVSTMPAWFPKSTGGETIGEAWLTAEECTVQTSAQAPAFAAAATLGELTRQFPRKFGNAAGHGFPLLMKLLFPREKLSVQVHPNDHEAQQLGWPRGKTECWYVLDAEPGAEVAVGLREPLTTDAIRSAIELQTLEDKLQYLPVQAGDMVFVDAGTIHAIGPGMTVLETQQYSDITYRLYDYGRPRELHVDAGLAVSRAITNAGLVPPQQGEGYTGLARSPYFAVDRFDLAAGETRSLGKAGELQILIALGEGVQLLAEALPATTLPAGHAVVLPAEPVSYNLRTPAGCAVIRVAEGETPKA